MVIDALAFARSAQVLEGRLLAAQCSRLCEDLPEDQPGAFEWRLSGRSGVLQSWLHVQAQGLVRVVCQRCLQPFDLTLGISNTLELLDNAEQLEAMDTLETEGHGPETEYLVANERLDVQALIEDELILALPYAPRHDVCPDAHQTADATDETSPFAVLAQLRKH